MAKNKNPTPNALVPVHTKLSEKDKKVLLEKYHCKFQDLPRILITDPAIAHLGVKEGDVIMIERKSRTAGESVFYRGVINE
ncbi:DNA-directed RNA polymerase subunit H [Candidatus Woesearchaeota archaeon]|nr:DNA-directed RNA polymerase subunit H [Candidatus Woesearchaeota archaeon]